MGAFLIEKCKDTYQIVNEYSLRRSWDSFIFELLFLDGSDGKESSCSAGDPDSIPGLGRSPGEGNGNPLQYSCLENPMDRGAWWAAVHGVTNGQTLLSN